MINYYTYSFKINHKNKSSNINKKNYKINSKNKSSNKIIDNITKKIADFNDNNAIMNTE